MLTKELIDLITWADSLADSSGNITELVTRTTSFLSVLHNSLGSVKTALSYLYFFIPKAYFEPLITIFLLIMLVKCAMALVNLLYP